MNQKSHWRRNFVASIILSLIIAGAGYAYWNRVELIDTWRAHKFSPSSELAAAVARTTMSAKAKKVFYASEPRIESTSRFNSYCGQHESSSATLGCFAPKNLCHEPLPKSIDRYGCYEITLFKVQNDQLNGIVDVTAAHEMLHAVYARLDDSERQKVNRMLAQKGNELSKDDVFKKRMEVYQSLSLEERMDELHSIIGTEVSNLPNDLETYYRQYFVDRHAVTVLYSNYSEKFSVLQRKSEELAGILDSMATSINQRVTDYNNRVGQIKQQITRFNDRAVRGDFDSMTAFNNERSQLQAVTEEIKNEESAIRAAIANYEEVRAQYDSVALDLSKLNKSIDSSLAPAPAV